MQQSIHTLVLYFGLKERKRNNYTRNCHILHCILMYALAGLFLTFLIETGTKWDFLEGHPSYRGVAVDRGHLEHFVWGSRGGTFL